MDAVFVFSVRAFSVKVMSVKIALGLLLMTVVNHMPMTRICEFEHRTFVSGLPTCCLRGKIGLEQRGSDRRSVILDKKLKF